MIRQTWKYLLVGAIFAGALTLGASRADAHLLWWRHWGAACWWCDPCCGVAYYPSAVFYAPWRPVYRTWYRPWHWCDRCCIWCYSCPCDPCCDGGAIVSQDVTSQPSGPTLAPSKAEPGAGETKPGTIESGKMPGPAKAEAPEKTETQGKPSTPEAGKTGLETASDRGLLTIQVPERAKVFINGHETRSQGTRRQYLSTGLLPGKVYPYAITVWVPRDSQAAGRESAAPQWETRVETVYLTAGEQLSLNFDRAMKTVLVARGQ